MTVKTVDAFQERRGAELGWLEGKLNALDENPGAVDGRNGTLDENDFKYG